MPIRAFFAILFLFFYKKERKKKMKKPLRILAALVKMPSQLIVNFVEWGTTPIRFESILLYVGWISIAMIMMAKFDVLRWGMLPISEVQKQMGELFFWFMLMMVALTRIIAGISANVEKVNQRRKRAC
jgi:hypothetical protein